MSFTVSSLTAYSEKATQILTSKLLFSNKIDLFSLEDNIQGSKYINTVSATLLRQAGTCGTAQSGSTTFGQVTLSVFPISYKLQNCFEDLYAKGLTIERQAIAKGADVMVEDALTNEYVKQIEKDIWQQLWIGDDAGSNYQFDGWFTQANAAADRDKVALSNSATTFGNYSASTMNTAIQNMCTQAVNNTALWAAASEGPLYLFVSQEVFNLYRQYLVSANLYRFGPSEVGVKELDIPGYEGLIKIMEIPELHTAASAAPKMLLTYPKNLFIGTSLVDNVTSPKAEYVVDVVNDWVYFKSSLRLGAVIGVTSHVVTLY